MAIFINDALFTTNGAQLSANNLYIDVMIIFPHGTADVQARLQPFTFEDGAKTSGPLQIDGVHQFSFPPTALVTESFWNDINAGNAHDYIISLMEQEQPQWQGKITKTIPIE